MKRFLILITAALLMFPAAGQAARRHKAQNQWQGRKVAFLGDSMTDIRHIGTEKNYWQYLAEELGIEPLVYGINGNQWSDVMAQAERLASEHPDCDAIMIFAGTNDFNAAVPLGQWYDTIPCEVEAGGGRMRACKKRTLCTGQETFKARINSVMSYLKQTFPEAQIILLTPIHRAYARFSETNVQPDESYSNTAGMFIDDYVQSVKEAAGVWAVAVIDINSESGLYPLCKQHERYFNNPRTDMLHPNAEGHRRIAKVLAYRMLGMPADFR